MVLSLTVSCKQGNKIERFNTDELLKKEQDSVRELLTLSRVLIEKGRYEEAKDKLIIIINNFGTYQEVVEANSILENLNLKLLIKRINNSQSIDTIKVLVENVSDVDVRVIANKKIEDIISDSNSIKELEDYLNSQGFNAHADLANERLVELKEKNKRNAYLNAQAVNDSKTWKKFLNDYPNHPEKEQITKNIVVLEIEEIFSGEYGEIPPSQLTGTKNYEVSTIQITNDTRYTLTLRYSGPEVRKINISPGSLESVKFKSGVYKVTASVNAAGVRNFAGVENLHGEYSSTYYISSN